MYLNWIENRKSKRNRNRNQLENTKALITVLLEGDSKLFGCWLTFNLSWWSHAEVRANPWLIWFFCPGAIQFTALAVCLGSLSLLKNEAFASKRFFSNFDSCPTPVVEMQSHTMTEPPSCFTDGCRHSLLDLLSCMHFCNRLLVTKAPFKLVSC